MRASQKCAPIVIWGASLPVKRGTMAYMHAHAKNVMIPYMVKWECATVKSVKCHTKLVVRKASAVPCSEPVK